MMRNRRYFTWKRKNSFPIYSYSTSRIICWRLNDHEFLYHRIIYNNYITDNEYCIVNVDKNQFNFIQEDEYYNKIPSKIESKYFEGLSYAGDDDEGISISIYSLGADKGFIIVENAQYLKSINNLAIEKTPRELFDKYMY